MMAGVERDSLQALFREVLGNRTAALSLVMEARGERPGPIKCGGFHSRLNGAFIGRKDFLEL